MYRPLQYSVYSVQKGCAFGQDASSAVFDDCSLTLLGVGESLEGVVDVFAVS